MMRRILVGFTLSVLVLLRFSALVDFDPIPAQTRGLHYQP